MSAEVKSDDLILCELSFSEETKDPSIERVVDMSGTDLPSIHLSKRARHLFQLDPFDPLVFVSRSSIIVPRREHGEIPLPPLPPDCDVTDLNTIFMYELDGCLVVRLKTRYHVFTWSTRTWETLPDGPSLRFTSVAQEAEDVLVFSQLKHVYRYSRGGGWSEVEILAPEDRVYGVICQDGVLVLMLAEELRKFAALEVQVTPIKRELDRHLIVGSRKLLDQNLAVLESMTTHPAEFAFTVQCQISGVSCGTRPRVAVSALHVLVPGENLIVDLPGDLRCDTLAACPYLTGSSIYAATYEKNLWRYELRTQKWTELPDQPEQVRTRKPRVVLESDDGLFLAKNGFVAKLDQQQGTWSLLPVVYGDLKVRSLFEVEKQLFAVCDGDDLPVLVVFDPQTGWQFKSDLKLDLAQFDGPLVCQVQV